MTFVQREHDATHPVRRFYFDCTADDCDARVWVAPSLWRTEPVGRRPHYIRGRRVCWLCFAAHAADGSF